MTQAAPASPSRARWARWTRRAFRGLLLASIGLVLIATTLWAALAICFADLRGPKPRHGLAALFLAAVIAAVVFVRPRRFRWLVPPLFFLAVLAWFFSLAPSNDRDWSPEVARLSYADVAGHRVTVRNVRNFSYRAEADYTPAWEDRTYDLDRLRTMDLMLVYWGSQAIAHAMVSFDFDDGQYLACSIETRKERGESYSAVQGFFRQYELIYVFADERDVVRLRTNYRKEDVYLYRTRVTPERARAIFLSYIDRANKLRDRPEWYNALTANCATSLLPHAKAGGGKGEMSIDVLLSGHAARQAYRNGVIDTSMPLDELEARSRVNDVALGTRDGDPDFSTRIRANLPIPAGWAGGSMKAGQSPN
jgi:hypothetical protein